MRIAERCFGACDRRGRLIRLCGMNNRSFLLEPLRRWVFHFYWRFSRGLTLGARAVVLDPAGKIFLVKHSYVDGWHLPGGGVEPGEMLVDALARELREEGNITLVGTPVLHGIFFNNRGARRDHVAVFVVREFVQRAMPTATKEIIDHGFYSPEQLPADTTAGTRARIAEVVQSAPISLQW
jgi:ADP-ribose pyrophosphatase YjhB (NUDIX family)